MLFSDLLSLYCGQRVPFKYMNCRLSFHIILNIVASSFILPHPISTTTPLSPHHCPAWLAWLPRCLCYDTPLSPLVYPAFPSSRSLHRVSHCGESSGGLLVSSKWGNGKGKGHVRVWGAPVIFNNIGKTSENLLCAPCEECHTCLTGYTIIVRVIEVLEIYLGWRASDWGEG